jgi:hypothetical protein
MRLYINSYVLTHQHVFPFTLSLFPEGKVVDPDCAGDESIKFIGFFPSHPNHSTL